MEKWIPSLPLWKRVSARGKPPTQKTGHRGGFPPASPLSHSGESEPGSTFPQALRRVLLFLQNHFLFFSQPDISLAIKSGHFHLLITFLRDN
jgi:hypothetical protein